MAADIQKGSRIDLTKTRPDLSQLAIRINWESPDSYDIDAAVFMADQNGHCPDDSSMIFYGNSVSTDQSVQHSVVAETGRSTEIFHINLPLITPSIEKLVFTLTIYEGDKKNQTFSEMNNASILFSNAATGEELLTYKLGSFTIENTLVLGELYNRNGDWKFSANTGGFSGGLAALCNHFGIEVEEEQESGAFEAAPALEIESPILQETAVKPEPPIVPEPAAQQQPIKLGKITLDKPGEGVSLRKAAKIENVKVRLKWTKGVDLDLHAFYKTKTGQFGHIFFGNKGGFHASPFIKLDRDSGVGNTSGNNSENLTIKTLKDLDSVIIATNIFRFLGFISKGENFARYDGRVLVKTGNGDDIEVPLTSKVKGRWCIICKIDNTDAADPKVLNINRVQSNKPDIGDL